MAPLIVDIFSLTLKILLFSKKAQESTGHRRPTYRRPRATTTRWTSSWRSWGAVRRKPAMPSTARAAGRRQGTRRASRQPIGSGGRWRSQRGTAGTASRHLAGTARGRGLPQHRHRGGTAVGTTAGGKQGHFVFLTRTWSHVTKIFFIFFLCSVPEKRTQTWGAHVCVFPPRSHAVPTLESNGRKH